MSLFSNPAKRWARENVAIQRRDRAAAKAQRQATKAAQMAAATPAAAPLSRALLVLDWPIGRHAAYEQPRQQEVRGKTWSRQHKQAAPGTTNPAEDQLARIAEQCEREQDRCLDAEALAVNPQDDLAARFAGAPARKFFALPCIHQSL